MHSMQFCSATLAVLTVMYFKYKEVIISEASWRHDSISNVIRELTKRHFFLDLRCSHLAMWSINAVNFKSGIRFVKRPVRFKVDESILLRVSMREWAYFKKSTVCTGKWDYFFFSNRFHLFCYGTCFYFFILCLFFRFLHQGITSNRESWFFSPWTCLGYGSLSLELRLFVG